MKKIKSIVMIFALFAISISIKGQSEIGVKIGLGVPYYKSTFDDNVFIKPNSIINCGIFYDIKIDKMLKFGTSLSYQRHKFSTSVLTSTSDYSTYSNYDYSLEYFYLKLYPQFTFGDKVIFVIQFGPTLSSMITSHEVGTTKTYQGSNVQTKSYNGEIRRRVVEDGFGVFSSIGVEIKFRDVIFTPSIQYQYSMNSLIASPYRYTERSILLNWRISYTIGQ